MPLDVARESGIWRPVQAGGTKSTVHLVYADVAGESGIWRLVQVGGMEKSTVHFAFLGVAGQVERGINRQTKIPARDACTRFCRCYSLRVHRMQKPRTQLGTALPKLLKELM